MTVRASLGAAIAMISLAGCVGAPSRSVDAPLRPGDHYVAMGSSFAAGAGIGPTKPGTPARCQRTALNYASQLADRLQLQLSDVTCGGATTAHLLGPWNDLPPQLDALTPETRLVTVTIGGNDLGYVAGLFGGSCRAGAALRPGPCGPNSAPDEAAYGGVEQGLRDIAAEVRRRAPRARLALVQYVTLVPDAPCDRALLTPEDAEVSRAIALRLAAITRRVARDAGALLIAADEASRRHTACDAVAWNSGMTRDYDLARGGPWHPTPAGMRAVADLLVEALIQGPAQDQAQDQAPDQAPDQAQGPAG